MKHIKQKFSHQYQLPDGFMEKKVALEKAEFVENIKDIEIPDNYVGWFISDKNLMIKTFRYEYLGQKLYIPEPDPVLVYFNTAQINFRLIEEIGSRKELIESLQKAKDLTDIMHKLYNFFSQSSSFAIFCFMAMESLVNKIIPDDHLVRKEMDKKTEEYNIHQIQQMDFMKKVKEILPEVTKKSFWKDHPDDYQNLHDLKQFRDEIVHTKKQIEDETYYRQIFVTSLKFEYTSTLYSVKKFINYYLDNLVEECGCGADF